MDNCKLSAYVNLKDVENNYFLLKTFKMWVIREGFMEEIAFILCLEGSQACCSEETFRIQGRT